MDSTLNIFFENSSESEIVQFIKELLNRSESLQLREPEQRTKDDPDLMQGFDGKSETSIICEICYEFPDTDKVNSIIGHLNTHYPDELYIIILTQVLKKDQENFKKSFPKYRIKILDIDNLKSRIKEFPDLQSIINNGRLQSTGIESTAEEDIYEFQLDSIKNLIRERKTGNFWWLNTNHYFWDQFENENDKHVENFSDLSTTPVKIDKGDIVISFYPKDKRITGILEFVGFDPKKEFGTFRGLYQFEKKTSHDELSELPQFSEVLNIYPSGSIHELGKPHFQEIINTTELGDSFSFDAVYEDDALNENSTDNIPFHLDYVEEIDRLNREPIAKSLARLLNNQIFKEGKKVRHSFMIHLQGAWGDGKSTFLKLLSKHLKGVDEKEDPLPEARSKWLVIDFNAWRHQHIDPPWWVLIDTIYHTIQNSAGRKKGIWWKEQWWRLVTLNRLYWISFIALLVLFLVVNLFSGFEWLNLRLLISDSKEGGKIISVITSYISIIGSFWFLIKAISGSLIPASSEAALQFRKNVRDPMDVLKSHFEDVVNYTDKNIAVFIDDLDRCNTEFTVGILEGIQTLFKEQAVLYVVAGDRHWISTCFENHYEKYKDVAREPAQKLGHLFLEKAFQLSIRLPKISGNTKKSYWDFILNPNKKVDKDNRKIEAVKKQEVKTSIDTNYSSEDLIKPENMKKIAKEHNINLEQATDLVLEVMDEDQKDIKHMLQDHHHLIDANPRGVKRLANQYTVYRNILTAEGRDFKREKLFRWLILQNKFSVYTDWLESHIDSYANGENFPSELKDLNNDEKWKELFFEKGSLGDRVLEPDDIAIFTGMKNENKEGDEDKND